MNYTLGNTKEKINQFADKIGSDYFTLPVVLDYFETAAYDFIGDHLRHVEINQTITDDIRPLVKKRDLKVEYDEPFLRYIAAVPTDYLRLLSYDLRYEDESSCRRISLVTHGEHKMTKVNPHSKPTKYYPVVVQEDSLWGIECGAAVPNVFRITYAKKPTFASTSDLEVRIVNLPDDAIEKIMLMTVTRLFGSTGDKRTQSNKALEETFRKVFV
jgi:hypothetical protein